MMLWPINSGLPIDVFEVTIKSGKILLSFRLDVLIYIHYRLLPCLVASEMTLGCI